MHPRAAELIALLALRPHPEGGFYREIHRSTASVARSDGAIRSALTAIYYLLVAGEAGAWHRVAADEVWHYYEGAAVELAFADGGAAEIRVHRLGPLGDGAQPVQIVPAGYWQAASTLGGYSLVGCCVGPGFDFQDFELARDLPARDAQLSERLRAYDQSSPSR
jgi:predicted cupin superfamily sugar epimerase